MTTTLAPSPVFRQWDNNGNPLAGGQLFTYAAGTSTPIPTYTDSTGSSQNPNPLTLNNRGEAQVWLTPNVAYKFNLTDSQGNQIPGFPIDQIVNSQLITLYGGVDTGVANAYVINFTANFTAYTDGVIVYWVASNANTGASTININGLGPIALTNQDGTALRAGEILANSVIGVMIKGGSALLLTGNIASGVLAVPGTGNVPSIAFAGDPFTGFFFNGANKISYTLGGNIGTIATGTVTFTITGISGSPQVSGTYFYNGFSVLLRIPQTNGTSNSTSFSMAANLGTIPGPNTPQWQMAPAMEDNGAAIYAQTASIATIGSPPSAIVVTFYKNGNATGWTGSGTKGIGDGTTGNYVTVGWMVA